MNKLRIGVDFGHTLQGKNFSALGILAESVETRKVGFPLIDDLKALGHEVINVTVDYANSTSESIGKRINKANSSNLDILISVHLNAYNGEAFGVEVLTYNGRYMVEADRILKNIEKLGYKNRGIKNGTSPRKLGVINSTNMPSMIVEVFFCDNKGDVNKYSPNQIARAIAEGVTHQSLNDKQIVEKPNYPIIPTPTIQHDKINLMVISKYVVVKGFLEDDTNYININDSYVSIREIFENLSLKVIWDNKLKQIVAEFDKHFKKPQNSIPVMLLGNKIDVDAILHEDKHCLKIDNAYIPIRDIFETMQFKVDYDRNNKIIVVSE